MYELNPSDRKNLVDQLVQLLPPSERDEARKTIDALAERFEGQDTNVVGVLWRAAEKGRFDDFAAKLIDYHEKEGRYVSVDARSAARNKNIVILRDIVDKEAQIAAGTRPASHRGYWPNEVQTLATYLGSVKMELFFADCYKEIMGKQ